jgi:hypothetical protein
MNQKKTITGLRREEEKKYKMYEKSYVVAASLSLKAGKGTPHHNTKCDWSVILPSQDDSLNYKL